MFGAQQVGQYQYSLGYSFEHSLQFVVIFSPHLIQFLYSFGFNVQQFWHVQLLDKHESLHEVLSRLYQIGLIARYSGIPIIGVSIVTNKTDIIWKNELFVLAEISFAVHIMAIIRKNMTIQMIIIAIVFEFSSPFCVSKTVNKLSRFILFG